MINMTFKEYLIEQSNIKKARKIRANVKDKAKNQNPEENDPQSGWNSDPRQGEVGRFR